MKQFAVLASVAVIPARESTWEDHLPKMVRSRTPRIWRMAKVAVERLLANGGPRPASISVATALGALDETVGFLEGVFAEGFGSPKNFIASVHNSMAGTIAVEQGITGPNLTYCDGHNSLAAALSGAELLNDDAFPLLLIAVDEKADIIKQLQPGLSTLCRSGLAQNWEEAAVAFLIDLPKRHENKAHIGGTVVEPILDGSHPRQAAAIYIDRFLQGFGTSLSLADSSDSFIKPALCAHEILAAGVTQNTLIPSYAPSVHATAAILISPAE